jgi:hypothetical protein
MTNYGRAIFGDNQFLGVNHFDQSKASSLFKQFSNSDAIIKVLGWAYEAGIRDFMFTTHERFDPVFDEICKSHLFPEMFFTPCLPYAHKYANAMAEKGMMRVVLENLRSLSKFKILGASVRAALRDFSGLMRLLIEVELVMCKGLRIRGVFLQNVMFDLLLALNARRLLESYFAFVSERLGVIPGFITMNHAAALDILCNQIGLSRPWVCSNYNASGFRMNPSEEAVVASFGSCRSKNIAMSVFAAGALDASSSLDYVLRAPGVNSVLFGSSRRENILQNAFKIAHANPSRQ